MALTRGDDFPIHQTSEPIAYAGTDRNFYDRYFFNGYGQEGDDSFALALGVYPHLNIADASFCVVDDGVQTALHASRWLNMERMDLQVGPIRVEVVEPLRQLRLIVEAPEQGLAADLVFTGRSFPAEEPRFIRRNGPRAFMDYTRLTQNGHWRGWLERDGKRRDVDGYVGTRDRSWGVRPVGARDPQEVVPPVAPQFFWIWAPANFPGAGSFFFHTNDDAAGLAWNRRAVWARDATNADQHDDNADCNIDIAWQSGTRQAKGAVVRLRDEVGERKITYTPRSTFFMLGLGYGHPKWGHGLSHGRLEVEREDLVTAEVDVHLPQHLHIQALCDVLYEDPSGRSVVGRGVLEQLAIGPHKPSGFAQMLDFAP
ncbi:MAG TPA: hypothetical protein VG248_15560 [Caulobacteraceae bacterium]|jgi:hypothetical protein|nr:hypothetical protein [Caulobacteraceae bacterium]